MAGPRAGVGVLFVGLPPFAVDMAPQGYIGSRFASRHPELGLPSRLTDWTDDHRLVALGLRGEDCVGNLVIGDESLHRLVSQEITETQRSHYPELAQRSMRGEVGSSAGGEHPKFGAFRDRRHFLVKYVGGEGKVAQRWRDLLWCEALALRSLRAAGFSAARAECFDEGDHRFLESERFDRIGERGRRGLLSLYAIDNEYFGQPDNWTQAALRLHASGLLSEADARTLRWWDAFGELIGNTDRHFGNISFHPDGAGGFRLAPCYDMLPMILAPSFTALVERPFSPRPPTATRFDVWPEAAQAARNFWREVSAEGTLDEEVRRFAEAAEEKLRALVSRVAPQSP